MQNNIPINVHRVGNGFEVTTMDVNPDRRVCATKKELLRWIDKHFTERRSIMAEMLVGKEEVPNVP